MSKIQLQIVFTVVLVFIGFDEALSKEWRSIVPLRSTREDVIRTLNQCKNSDPSCEFTIDNEFVHIEFSGDEKLHDCDPQVKRDTVLLIEVFPTRPLTLKKSGFDKRRFKTVDMSPFATGYLDEQNGLVLKVERGKIIQIDYIASFWDRNLCPSYYVNPVSFIQSPFDSHVPVIYLNCPSEPTRAGGMVKLSADFAGKPKITFLWSLSAGKIISGQGTRVIEIDTTGLEGQTIVATTKLGRVQSSCELHIVAK